MDESEQKCRNAEDKETGYRKKYTDKEFVSKLRRLADCIENGNAFRIQIAGEK